MLDGSKGNWCSGCEPGKEDIIQKEGTKDLKLPKSCYHSNHRYLHQKPLSIVYQFPKSGHLFLARSKIHHILAGLGPPGSKYVV